MGGEGKGQDFAPLAQAVSRYVRAVVLIGRDAAQIRARWRDTGVPLLDAESMPQRCAGQRQSPRGRRRAAVAGVPPALTC